MDAVSAADRAATTAAAQQRTADRERREEQRSSGPQCVRLLPHAAVCALAFCRRRDRQAATNAVDLSPPGQAPLTRPRRRDTTAARRASISGARSAWAANGRVETTAAARAAGRWRQRGRPRRGRRRPAAPGFAAEQRASGGIAAAGLSREVGAAALAAQAGVRCRLPAQPSGALPGRGCAAVRCRRRGGVRTAARD